MFVLTRRPMEARNVPRSKEQQDKQGDQRADDQQQPLPFRQRVLAAALHLVNRLDAKHDRQQRISGPALWAVANRCLVTLPRRQPAPRGAGSAPSRGSLCSGSIRYRRARVDLWPSAAVDRSHLVYAHLGLADGASALVAAWSVRALQPGVDARPAEEVPALRQHRLGGLLHANVALEGARARRACWAGWCVLSAAARDTRAARRSCWRIHLTVLSLLLFTLVRCCEQIALRVAAGEQYGAVLAGSQAPAER